MKSILTIFLFFGLVVSSFSQTRNVVVDTSGAVVQPTNIWTANATNARSGLGLGSAATNPASAFQPSSATLSNLASNNGVNLTNISINGVVGALATNGNASGLTNLIAANITGTVALASNITGIVAISNGGTGSINAGGARTNLGLGWSALTNTNTATSLLGFTTNGQVVANTGTNVLTFTNDFSVRDNAGDSTSFTFYGMQGWGAAVNLEERALRDGETVAFQWGALENTSLVPLNFDDPSSAATTRTNLGLGWSALTNTNAATSLLGITTNGQVVYTNTNTLTFANSNVSFQQIILPQQSGTVSGNINFGNGVFVGRPSGQNVVFNVTGIDRVSLGTDGIILYADEAISFSTNNTTGAAATRANLGFSTNLNTLWTATNASNARSAVGLGVTDSVTFSNVMVGSLSGVAGGFVGFDTSGQLTLRGTNLTASVPAFFGYDGFNVTAMSPSSSRLRLGFSTNLNTLWEATNASNARSAIGLGETNSPTFNTVTTGTNGISVGNAAARFSQSAGGGGAAIGWQGSGQRITFISGIGMTLEDAGLGIAFGASNTNGAAISRTNLGLGWPALTNSNAGTGLVSVNTNGEVVSPANFWQVAPIQTLVQDFTSIATSQTNNATNARNVYIYSFNTNVSGISNTIILPTNTSTFNGDEATVIHRGTTNTATVVRQAGSTNNLITLNRFDESVKFIRELGQWDFYHNISFVEPIQFSGTNASNNVAASRTNLGLGSTNTVTFGIVSIPANGTNTVEVNIGSQGIEFNGDKTNGLISFVGTNLASAFRSDIGLPLAALTNTNAAGFQRAIFTTNSAPTNSANINTVNFNTAVAWMEVSVITNGVTNSYRIPLFQ